MHVAVGYSQRKSGATSRIHSVLTWNLRVLRALSLIVLVFVAVVGGLAALARLSANGGDAELLGHPVFVVSTGSMEPTIPVGSLLVLDKLSAAESQRLSVGDIVTFHPASGSPDALVTHRIVAITRVGATAQAASGTVRYTTQGDANQSPDLTPLDPARIVGVYARHVPIVGRLIEGFGRGPVVALFAVSLLLAQFALEQRPIRGTLTRKKGSVHEF